MSINSFLQITQYNLYLGAVKLKDSGNLVTANFQAQLWSNVIEPGLSAGIFFLLIIQCSPIVYMRKGFVFILLFVFFYIENK